MKTHGNDFEEDLFTSVLDAGYNPEMNDVNLLISSEILMYEMIIGCLQRACHNDMQ